MTAPHQCPNCKGKGKIDSPFGELMSNCPSCKGEGIVWTPLSAEEAKDAGVIPGQLDLTYDGE